jgi:hypothetical protein
MLTLRLNGCHNCHRLIWQRGLFCATPNRAGGVRSQAAPWLFRIPAIRASRSAPSLHCQLLQAGCNNHIGKRLVSPIRRNIARSASNLPHLLRNHELLLKIFTSCKCNEY